MDVVRANRPPADRVAYVSPNFFDNYATHEFSTIQAAIDFMFSKFGYIPDWDQHVMVIVYPGKYREQIHSYLAYHIVGISQNSGPEYKTVKLFNNGTDPTSYPLRNQIDDIYIMEGITIETDRNGVFGSISANSHFNEITFVSGCFIEAIAPLNIYMTIRNSSFISYSRAFNMTGTPSGYRYIQIDNTHFAYTTNNWALESTHDDVAKIFLDGCVFNNNCPDTKGDWSIQVIDTHVFGTRRTYIDTTGEIAYLDSIISNGLHFTTSPYETIIHSCSFYDNEGYPIIGTDITSDVTIPIVDYVGNIQQNGLPGEIQIIHPVKTVGGDALNRYATIQYAIDSISISGIVELNESYISLQELNLKDNTTVVIDGKRSYTLDFLNDIVELNLNQSLTFSRLLCINGETIEINGNGAEIHIHNCNSTSTYSILATSGIGSNIHINNTSYIAPVGLSAVEYNSTDPNCLVEYSKLMGSTGQPAIQFNVDADGRLKTKFSTFIHGDGGVNAPIIHPGPGKVDISIYNCGLNASWNPAYIFNTIGTANNTVDQGIDF